MEFESRRFQPVGKSRKWLVKKSEFPEQLIHPSSSWMAFCKIPFRRLTNQFKDATCLARYSSSIIFVLLFSDQLPRFCTLQVQLVQPPLQRNENIEKLLIRSLQVLKDLGQDLFIYYSNQHYFFPLEGQVGTVARTTSTELSNFWFIFVTRGFSSPSTLMQ